MQNELHHLTEAPPSYPQKTLQHDDSEITQLEARRISTDVIVNMDRTSVVHPRHCDFATVIAPTTRNRLKLLQPFPSPRVPSAVGRPATHPDTSQSPPRIGPDARHRERRLP